MALYSVIYGVYGIYSRIVSERGFKWFHCREWYRTEFQHAPEPQEVGADGALRTRTKALLSICVWSATGLQAVGQPSSSHTDVSFVLSSSKYTDSYISI